MSFSVKKKIWIEYNHEPILGEGRYSLLKNIEKTRSLKKSAELLKVSEKTAHNYIKRMESRLRKKIIKSSKGGKDAGGKTELTTLGRTLLKKFEAAL